VTPHASLLALDPQFARISEVFRGAGERAAADGARPFQAGV
jgi:hypothetical protein